MDHLDGITRSCDFLALIECVYNVLATSKMNNTNKQRAYTQEEYKQ